MELNKIIYDIRERLKLNSDDIGYTDEYLAHLIDINRVFLVKQRFTNFTKNVPEELKQVICVDLEVADSIDGEPCFGNVLRSVSTIPSLLEIGGRSAIIGVRVEDIMHPHLNIVSTERLPYVGYNKWLTKEMYIALDGDNKLYIKSSNPQHLNLEKIKLIGVFSSPEEADAMLCTPVGEECDYFEKEYPMEGYLIKDLVNMIIQDIAPTLIIPKDNVNDSSEPSNHQGTGQAKS